MDGADRRSDAPALGSAQMKAKLVVGMEGFGVKWKAVSESDQ